MYTLRISIYPTPAQAWSFGTKKSGKNSLRPRYGDDGDDGDDGENVSDLPV